MKDRLLSTTVIAALAAAIITWLAISFAFVVTSPQSEPIGNEVVVTLLQLAFPFLVVGTVGALPPAFGLAVLARRRANLVPHLVLLSALVGCIWVPVIFLAFFLGTLPGPAWVLALAGIVSGAAAGLVITRLERATASGRMGRTNQ